MGADQPWTADRCRALGVARVLDPLTCTPLQVTTTVTALLDDSPEKHAAQAVAQQTAELPTTAEPADLLEALAR
jgi:UDP:flavonoid glycosyltransferase YjiC (YdhE family)